MTTDKTPAALADEQDSGRARLGDALLPCPFCGAPAERIDFGIGSGENEGGSCIACTVCQHSGPIEFGFKENFVSNWNRRALSAQPSPGGQDAPRCAEHCQNGFADICLASQRDGVICPEDSCDIDDGIRHNHLAARQPVGEPVACVRDLLPPEVLSAISACAVIAKKTSAYTVQKYIDAINAWLYAAPPAQAVDPVPTFQAGVAEWMAQCFLPSLYSNMTERGDRLLEEVLELLQAHGYDKARVPTLVDYVFGRPVGEPAQEVGGVMVTLAGYCWVAGLDMHAAGDAELARITQPDVMAKIRAKQEAKNALHFDTPLPGNAARQPVGERPMEMRICELRHVSLKPNRPYIFTVDANCANCRADAAYAMGHTEARPAQAVDLGPVPLIARALAEWHEDDGNVLWWAWCGRDWAGEPAWAGTPNDSDWPGYHTHWTPHPTQPALLDSQAVGK